MRARRRMFGKVLADFQLTQAALADMATAIDAAALLTYRAAWLRDTRAAGDAGGGHGQNDGHRVRASASSIAPCRCSAAAASSAARRVERLYREIRSLRIYEGATEVQKLIIGREVLR